MPDADEQTVLNSFASEETLSFESVSCSPESGTFDKGEMFSYLKRAETLEAPELLTEESERKDDELEKDFFFLRPIRKPTETERTNSAENKINKITSQFKKSISLITNAFYIAFFMRN